MIVAAGAGDRQPHQTAADDVDLVVDEVVAVAELHADGEEAEPGQRRVVGGKPHLVGGDLLGDEPVPGDVAIERPHTVVAVGVGEGKLREADGTPTVGVGIAGDVEPMAPPAFAVAGRGEEAIDHAGEGFAVGGGVGLEGLDILPGRRQSREVECRPPDQFTPTDPGGLGEPTRLAGAREEAVDVGACRSVCGGDRRAADRGERPMPLVRSAGCDPAPQRVDLGRRQARPLRRGRHAQVGIGGENAAHQRALVWPTGEHGLRLGPLIGIQSQVPLARPGVEAVALQAVFGEDWPDIAVEANLPRAAERSGGDPASEHQGHRQRHGADGGRRRRSWGLHDDGSCGGDPDSLPSKNPQATKSVARRA